MGKDCSKDTASLSPLLVWYLSPHGKKPRLAFWRERMMKKELLAYEHHKESTDIIQCLGSRHVERILKKKRSSQFRAVIGGKQPHE